MKKLLFLFLPAFAFTLSGCGGDEAEDPTPTTPTPITITRSDARFGAEHTSQIQHFTEASFVAPTNLGMDNQEWDISNLPIDDGRIGTLGVNAYSNPDVPNANVSFNSTVTNGITGQIRPYTALREESAEGYFDLGALFGAEEVVPIFGGAGSLTFNSGLALNDPKLPVVEYPLTKDYDKTVTAIYTNDFVVNYPDAGLNNVPANTVDTQVVTYTTGWGTLKIPSSSEALEVLAVRRVTSSTRNYLLGGQPAPANLLAGLGLQDGEVSNFESVEFYAKGKGVVARYTIGSDGKVGVAFYRTDL